MVISPTHSRQRSKVTPLLIALNNLLLVLTTKLITEKWSIKIMVAVQKQNDRVIPVTSSGETLELKQHAADNTQER